MKKLWRSTGGTESRDSLVAEVELLGRLRHRNIVRVVGYVHNENDVMMIYEYMPNGNLEQPYMVVNKVGRTSCWGTGCRDII